MGPIKIKIATTQIEGASEYDAPKTSEYDAPEATEKTVEASSEGKNGIGKTGEESCYSYEGSQCIYTEPGSGTKYMWDATRFNFF